MNRHDNLMYRKSETCNRFAKTQYHSRYLSAKKCTPKGIDNWKKKTTAQSGIMVEWLTTCTGNVGTSYIPPLLEGGDVKRGYEARRASVKWGAAIHPWGFRTKLPSCQRPLRQLPEFCLAFWKVSHNIWRNARRYM